MPQIDPQRVSELTSALREVPDDVLTRLELDPARLAALVAGLEAGPDAPVTAAGDRGVQDLVLPAAAAFPAWPQKLDVPAFGRRLVNALNGQCAGFAIRLWEPGGIGETMWSGYARMPGPDGDQLWNADIRMHVASVSKLITAMAATRLLADHGISADDPIQGHLPNYWTRGSDIDKVTFAGLLTHRSGFFNAGESDSDYGQLKAQIARGVYGVGSYAYENTNFSMFRVLIATITGDVPTNLRLTGLSEDANDRLWEALTITSYRNYVNSVVLAPSGVVGPTLEHPADAALGYGFPIAGTGWNSGDRSPDGGGDGWHLSANELVRLMRAYHREGTVVSNAQADEMLRRGFGIDWIESTAAGTIYGKNGNWSNPAGQQEQATVYFLPHGMYVVVLVNSPITAMNSSLLRLVRDTFVSSLVDRDRHDQVDVDPREFPVPDDHTHVDLDPPKFPRPDDHTRIDPGRPRLPF